MKVVNYSINTFYVLKIAISLLSLKLFLKKWEFKHLGSFPGLVPFQGDYCTVRVRVPGTVAHVATRDFVRHFFYNFNFLSSSRV